MYVENLVIVKTWVNTRTKTWINRRKNTSAITCDYTCYITHNNTSHNVIFQNKIQIYLFNLFIYL